MFFLIKILLLLYSISLFLHNILLFFLILRRNKNKFLEFFLLNIFHLGILISKKNQYSLIKKKSGFLSFLITFRYSKNQKTVFLFVCKKNYIFNASFVSLLTGSIILFFLFWFWLKPFWFLPLNNRNYFNLKKS